MSRPQTVLACILAGIVGVGIGVAGTLWAASIMANIGVLARAEGDLAVNLGIVERLQAGESVVAQQLAQIQLDSALITLDALAADGQSFSPKTYERLDRLRELRMESGYVPSDQGVADAVERALQLANAGTR